MPEPLLISAIQTVTSRILVNFSIFASSKEKNMYMKIKGRPMKMKRALGNPSEAPTVLPGVLLVWTTI